MDKMTMVEIGKIFYLADLKPGKTFHSRQYPVTLEEIQSFAKQYDPQPFHLDEAAAEVSLFKGLAASGWHTAAITMRLLTEILPVAGGLVGAGIEKLRWLKPVRPGDILCLECEILSSRESKSKPQQGFVRVKHITRNQHAEPVLDFISTIVVPKASS